MSLFAMFMFSVFFILGLAAGHFSVIPDMLVRNNVLYLEWLEVHDRSEIGFSFLLVGFVGFFCFFLGLADIYSGCRFWLIGQV